MDNSDNTIVNMNKTNSSRLVCNNHYKEAEEEEGTGKARRHMVGDNMVVEALSRNHVVGANLTETRSSTSQDFLPTYSSSPPSSGNPPLRNREVLPPQGSYVGDEEPSVFAAFYPPVLNTITMLTVIMMMTRVELTSWYDWCCP